MTRSGPRRRSDRRIDRLGSRRIPALPVPGFGVDNGGVGMTEQERAALASEIALAVTHRNGSHACSCDAEPPSASLSRTAPVASQIDQVLREPGASLADVERFLSASMSAGFRAVWVPPRWAALAVRSLRASGTSVGSFVGYPHGTSLTPVKCLEAETLLRLGVDEISMVADLAALRSHDLDAAFIDVQAVANVASCRGAHLNVILELPLLAARQKIEACAVAKLAGAQSVAWTGRYEEALVDLDDIALMRQTVGDETAVIAAGRVSSAGAAARALEAGADRIFTVDGLEIAVPTSR